MSLYQFLYTPLQIGPVRVRNRVVFSAHLTNFAEDNRPGERLIAYYRERAKGGAGLIITEEQSIHPSDYAYEKLIHAYDPAVVPHYRRLTDAIKAEGAAVFCQINHNGLQGFSFFNDEPLWGPSPVADTLFREIPQSLDTAQIEEVVAGYGKVAAHARAGGFDGIEFQASHSSILRQFLSPYTNRRSDEWGGSLEGRMRLTARCLEAAREALGPDVALGIRLCTDELIDGGLTLDAVVEIAAKLDKLGILDFINTSIGTTGRLYLVEGPMSVPSGYQSGHTAAIRAAVSVPVIGVGRINDPLMADRLLREGVCDLVGVVRAQIADPEWAGKGQAEQASEIRKCIACNQYCIGLMGLNSPLSCIQNPSNGSEATLGVESYGSAPSAPPGATVRRKRVHVIGAGPAGMEAAIVAAHEGHDVTLWERDTQLGGTVNWIVKTPQRLEYGDLIRNKTSELKRYGVCIKLGTPATVDTLIAEHPDAVIVATGQEETRPVHIPGMDGPRVRTPLQVLAESRFAPGHVLILDDIGFHQATSLAEYLVEGGCRISLVTSAFYVGQHLGVTLDLELWHTRMAQLGDAAGNPITLYPGHIALDVRDDPVLLDIQSGAQKTLPGVDWIVPVNPGRSRADLFHALRGRIPSIVRVGDALAPKDVGEAILDGHRAARHLSGMELTWR